MRIDGKNNHPDAYHFPTWQLSLAERGISVESEDDIDACLKEIFQRTNSLAKTGKALGMSKQTVRNHLVRLGVQMRPRGGATEERAAYLEYNGTRWRMTELCQRMGLTYDIVSHRIRKGWTVKQALETPPKKTLDKSIRMRIL